jgi:ferredoxin
MCEFCTKHGEGKKWYLQMKNYSQELLSARLSPAQSKVVGATTRIEWFAGFFEAFVAPATPGAKPKPKGDAAAPSPASPRRLSEAAVTRNAMAEHFGQVLPLKDVDEVLEAVTSITRIPCGCRYITTGKTDMRYCFGLGVDVHNIMGKYPDASASLEVLDKEEAKKLFRQFDRAGLVHSIWTGVTPYVIGLCNCDRDCGAYRGYIERGGPANFFRAEYVCEVDRELCTGCKSCMKQCQFAAQFYSHGLGKVYIDPKRCFGCGVCMAACPHDAIRLIPRHEHPEAKDLWLKKPARQVRALCRPKP